jgi:hypothetical protein
MSFCSALPMSNQLKYDSVVPPAPLELKIRSVVVSQSYSVSFLFVTSLYSLFFSGYKNEKIVDIFAGFYDTVILLGLSCLFFASFFTS